MAARLVRLTYNPETFQMEEAKDLLAEEGYAVAPLPFAGRGKPLNLSGN